jgi:hypothetical protein
MAKLTAAQRKKMPASKFYGPGRTFPINDKVHAQKALQFINDAPPSYRPAIRAAANRMLGKTSTPKKGK